VDDRNVAGDDARYDDVVRGWMAAIGDVNGRRFGLALPRAALLVVDMQRYFVDPASKGCMPWAAQVVSRVLALIAFFRARGRPVLFTRHVHAADGSDGGNLAWWWDGLLREGTWAAELHPSIVPAEGEPVLRKNRYDAFLGTDLDDMLRRGGVTDLVIAGCMTNLCCETTARDAFCRDYRVKFVADATATETEPMQLASLRNLAFGFADVVTVQEIVQGRA
jgi:nicotinamidase-related amidase